MINSRKIEDLALPTAKRAEKMLNECSKAGFEILVTSTWRDNESQMELWRIGRSKAGNPCMCGGKKNPIGACKKHPLGLTVTNAKPGMSFHNWRVAIDIVPLRYGKPVWGTNGNGLDDNPLDDDSDDLELWQSIAGIGKQCGLEWAGDWRSFKEFPHFQFTGGLSLLDFQKGKQLA